jgi:signal transduction histidine kinase
MLPGLPARSATPASPRPRPRWHWWVAGFAIWTVLGLLAVLQNAIFYGSIGEPVPWANLLPVRLADWYTCALFTPVYFWLVRRFPLDEGGWLRAVPVHLAATAVFVVAKYAIYTPVFNLLRPENRPARTFGEMLAGSFIIENVIFWSMIGVIQAIESFRKLREREVQAAQLAGQLANARLDVLTGQLHPHFLFNTLQGVSTLLHRDPAAADTMLARLSDLLRRTLQRDGRHEVTLSEELELLDLYLGIMRTRFADRLTVAIDVDAGLGAVLVPRFILQPLVENAIQHGIERRSGAGRIEVAGRRDGESLILSVRDDGPGTRGSGGRAPAEGVGLSNTRHRLRQLYGDSQRLELSDGAMGGFEVTMSIPFRPAADAAPTPTGTLVGA